MALTCVQEKRNRSNRDALPQSGVWIQCNAVQCSKAARKEVEMGR
jgi:hypothetical protein